MQRKNKSFLGVPVAIPKKVKIRIGLIVLLIAIGVILKIFIFKKSFLYAGTIEATKVDISARLTSVISKIHFKEGDHVKKGQILMTLTCEDYKLDDQIASVDFTRADKLYRQGSQSKEVFDQMKNKKDDADLKLSWCDISSPIDGIVLNKYHEEGEMVNPGMHLFTLANLKEDIYTYIYVPHDLINRISIGEKLTGVLPEANMREFSGIVSQIGEEAEFTPKNVQTREERTRLVFAVKIFFSNPEEVLKPGMTIEIRLPEK